MILLLPPWMVLWLQLIAMMKAVIVVIAVSMHA